MVTNHKRWLAPRFISVVGPPGVYMITLPLFIIIVGCILLGIGLFKKYVIKDVKGIKLCKISVIVIAVGFVFLTVAVFLIGYGAGHMDP
ncbi:hypothetical protein BVX98_00385 [bacterium F11]|nr:hypothetical protein BVX98_00385 [bacterium F11]